MCFRELCGVSSSLESLRPEVEPEVEGFGLFDLDLRLFFSSFREEEVTVAAGIVADVAVLEAVAEVAVDVVRGIL